MYNPSDFLTQKKITVDLAVALNNKDRSKINEIFQTIPNSRSNVTFKEDRIKQCVKHALKNQLLDLLQNMIDDNIVDLAKLYMDFTDFSLPGLSAAFLLSKEINKYQAQKIFISMLTQKFFITAETAFTAFPSAIIESEECLYTAICYDVALAEKLLAARAKFDPNSARSQRDFYRAACSGNIDTMLFFLEHGFSIDSVIEMAVTNFSQSYIQGLDPDPFKGLEKNKKGILCLVHEGADLYKQSSDPANKSALQILHGAIAQLNASDRLSKANTLSAFTKELIVESAKARRSAAVYTHLYTNKLNSTFDAYHKMIINNEIKELKLSLEFLKPYSWEIAALEEVHKYTTDANPDAGKIIASYLSLHKAIEAAPIAVTPMLAACAGAGITAESEKCKQASLN
ncbi:MAG: hypothetical protein Q7V63_02245 [Gammaproteobacteria bacterium]|nr:hypothetical protein [Gammaproteobacteria bacterium]